jgi:protein MAK11
VSTEDGRILFYSSETEGTANELSAAKKPIPNAAILCQLGGREAGESSRIKDFRFLEMPSEAGGEARSLLITASSSGSIKIWNYDLSGIFRCPNEMNGMKPHANGELQGMNALEDREADAQGAVPPRIGQLLGTYETGNRITCLEAFILLEDPGLGDEKDEAHSEDEFSGFSSGSDGLR